MPNVSRPDLLPFAGAVTLGLPYHGLVKNGNAQADPAVAGTLYLPSGATRTYTQPYDGGCIMVQHPRHAALTRNATEQAYDTAHDHQWIEYALLSGRLHQVGGQNLGQHYHLYCDADHAWKIRTALSSGAGTCTLKIYLNSLFGTFSDRSYAFTERLLATYTWAPENTSGAPLSGTVGNSYLATYSKTGAKIMLNVGTTASVSGLRHTISTQHNVSFLMHDAIRVSITGNGSLVAGSIGAGISATIDHVAWGDDLYNNNIADDGTYTETSKYHYVIDQNGNEAHIETTKENNCQFTPFVPLGNAGDVTSYQTRTISFGGATYTSTFTYAGTFNAGGECLNEGTAIINGTEVDLCDDSGTVNNCMFNSYDATFTIETVLPLVAVIVKQYDDTYLVMASGSRQAWSETTDQYYTYNPATGSVQVNGANRICYV